LLGVWFLESRKVEHRLDIFAPDFKNPDLVDALKSATDVITVVGGSDIPYFVGYACVMVRMSGADTHTMMQMPLRLMTCVYVHAPVGGIAYIYLDKYTDQEN